MDININYKISFSFAICGKIINHNLTNNRFINKLLPAVFNYLIYYPTKK